MAKIAISGFRKTANGIVPYDTSGKAITAKAMLQAGKIAYGSSIGTLSLFETSGGKTVYYNGTQVTQLQRGSIDISSNIKSDISKKSKGKIKETKAPYMLIRVHKFKNAKGTIKDYKYILREKATGAEKELLREDVEKFFENPNWDKQDRSKRLLGGSGALVDGLIENYYAKDDTWHLRVNKYAESVLDESNNKEKAGVVAAPDNYILTDVWARTLVAGAGKHKLEKYAYGLTNKRTNESDVYTRDQMMNLLLNKNGTGNTLYDNDRIENGSIQYYKNAKGSESWRIRVQESKVNWHVDELGNKSVNAVLYMCSKVYCVKVPDSKGVLSNQYVEFEVIPLSESDVDSLKSGECQVEEIFGIDSMVLTGADLVALTEKPDTIVYPFYDGSKLDNLKVKNIKGKLDSDRQAEIEVYKAGNMPKSSITQYYPEVIELDYEVWKKSHQEHVDKIEKFIKDKEARAVNTVITWDEIVNQPLSDEEMSIKGITFKDFWDRRLKGVIRISTLPLETDTISTVNMMYDILPVDGGKAFMVAEARTKGSMRSNSARKFSLEGIKPTGLTDDTLGHHWVRFLSCICNALDKRLILVLGKQQDTKFVITCADVVTQKKGIGDSSVYYLPVVWTERLSVTVKARNEASARRLAEIKLNSSLNHPETREKIGDIKLDVKMKAKLVAKKDYNKKPDNEWFKSFGAEVDLKASQAELNKLDDEIPGDIFKEQGEVVITQRGGVELNTYLVEATIEMCGYIAVEASSDEEAYSTKAAEVLQNKDYSVAEEKYILGSIEIETVTLVENALSDTDSHEDAYTTNTFSAWNDLDGETVALDGYEKNLGSDRTDVIDKENLLELLKKTDKVSIINLLDADEEVKLINNRTVKVGQLVEALGIETSVDRFKSKFNPFEARLVEYKLMQDVFKNRPSLVNNTTACLVELNANHFKRLVDIFKEFVIDFSFSGVYMEYKPFSSNMNLVYKQEIGDEGWEKSIDGNNILSLDVPGEVLVDSIMSVGEALADLYNNLFTKESDLLITVKYCMDYIHKFIGQKLYAYEKQVKARDVSLNATSDMQVLIDRAKDYNFFYDAINGKDRTNENLVLINYRDMDFVSFMNTLEFKKGFNTIKEIKADNKYVWRGLDAISEVLGVTKQFIQAGVLEDSSELAGPVIDDMTEERKKDILKMVYESDMIDLGNIYDVSGDVSLKKSSVNKRELLQVLGLPNNFTYDKNAFTTKQEDLDRLSTCYSTDDLFFELIKPYANNETIFEDALNFVYNTELRTGGTTYIFEKKGLGELTLNDDEIHLVFNGYKLFESKQEPQDYIYSLMTELYSYMIGTKYKSDTERYGTILLDALIKFLREKFDNFAMTDVEAQDRRELSNYGLSDIDTTGWEFFMYPNAVKDTLVAVNMKLFDFIDNRKIEYKKDNDASDYEISNIDEFSNNHLIKGVSNICAYFGLPEPTGSESIKDNIITFNFDLFNTEFVMYGLNDYTVETLYAESGHSYEEVLHLKTYINSVSIMDNSDIQVTQNNSYITLTTILQGGLTGNLYITDEGPSRLMINYKGAVDELIQLLPELVSRYENYLKEASNTVINVNTAITKDMFETAAPVSFIVGADEKFNVQADISDGLVPFVKPYADFLLRQNGGYAVLKLRSENLDNIYVLYIDFIKSLFENLEILYKYFDGTDYSVDVYVDNSIKISQSVIIDPNKSNKKLNLELELLASGGFKMTLSIDDMRWLKSRNVIAPWLAFDKSVVEILEKVYTAINAEADEIEWDGIDEISFDESSLEDEDTLELESIDGAIDSDTDESMSDDDLMALFNGLDTVDTSIVSDNLNYVEDEEVFDLGDLDDDIGDTEGVDNLDVEEVREYDYESLLNSFITIFNSLLLGSDISIDRGRLKSEYIFAIISSGDKLESMEACMAVRDYLNNNPCKIQPVLSIILDNIEMKPLIEAITSSEQLIVELAEMHKKYKSDFKNQVYKGDSGVQSVINDSDVTKALKEVGIDKSKFGFLKGVSRV